LMHFNIPKKYCFIEDFNKNLLIKLNNNIGIIYRNYISKKKYEDLIHLKQFCKKRKLKLFLANDYKLAIKLELDGVYIPSFNKSLRVNSYIKKKKFLILGSAHNLKEINIKENQNVNLIFLSPIFYVSKSKNFLGINKFNNLEKLTKKKVIALGGLKKSNLKKLKLTNSFGFASISYFR